MHFCSVCSNMYYLTLNADNDNQLIYYCRNCGNNETNIKDIVISKIQLKKSEQEFSHIINKYTKLDPALPRVTNVLCPNDNCPTNNKDEEREIIYIRYDNLNMKYVYLCATCDTVWKTEEQS
jgi:DNA-directed RNA polymerase subunit M/transcription elongation factor TFIIS